jgi:lipid-A-disaccharide synthase
VERRIVASVPTFFLTAAEHSGDALGAALIRALRRKYGEARFVGVGGDLMAAAGCQLLANPVKRSAMLIGGVVKGFWYWRKLLKRIAGEMQNLKPDVVVPIDSSFVNLRIAAEAKRQGLAVCYYVAPQVWASRPWRVKQIKECVDTLCCILPFEEKYFADCGVKAVYVGHPMFDELADSDQLPVAGSLSEEEAREAVREEVEAGARSKDKPLPGGTPRVVIFPGSRRAEVDAHMPAMMEVLAEIRGRFPAAGFVAVAPSEERAWQIRHHLRLANTPVDIRVGHADAIIRWSDLALVKSGTTTLQVARQGRPMVVMFAVPRWQWWVGRRFILTPYIALVNILAGREVVPEFIPFHGSAMPVARECLELLTKEGLRTAMVEELKAVVADLLPREGKLAADRVAEEVGKLVKVG